MTRHPFCRTSIASALVVCFLFAGATSVGFAADDEPTIGGVWSETWKPGEKTDVDYNDEYAVGLDGKNRPKVIILGRNQTCDEEEIDDDGALTFTLHTSFAVKYKLHLSKDGKSMTGTATTPNEVARVVWKRVR